MTTMTESAASDSSDDESFDNIELDLSFPEDKEYQAAYLKDLYSRGKTFRKYEEVLEEYEGLCMEIESTGNYQSAREQYRLLSFELNALGKLAPAFRRELRTGKKPTTVSSLSFIAIKSLSIVTGFTASAVKSM